MTDIMDFLEVYIFCKFSVVTKIISHSEVFLSWSRDKFLLLVISLLPVQKQIHKSEPS
jgi:hypothetical protein